MAAPPVQIPCTPWTTPELVRACCGGLDPDYDLTTAINYASAILFRLSGRQFPGECERVIHPCLGDNCGCCVGSALGDDWWWMFNAYPAWPVPNPSGDGFVNMGRCNNSCDLPCVQLPATINEIIEVVIDGEVLPATAYRIDAYRRLCRIDGEGWSCTNDLTARENQDQVVTLEVVATSGTFLIRLTEPETLIQVDTDPIAFNASPAAVQAALEAISWVGVGGVTVTEADGGGFPYEITFTGVLAATAVTTQAVDIDLGGDDPSVVAIVTTAAYRAPEGSWYIRYNYGKPVPLDGQLAASIFACQIALNLCGSEGCVLPQRLKSITREGMEMDFADPLTFLDEGKVGIYEVDLFLHSVNPSKLKRRSRVHRPDKPFRNKTWTS